MSTTTTTPAPTIDLGPLLELRAHYLTNADRLLAGVRADDPATLEEARAMISAEDDLGRQIAATIEGLQGDDAPPRTKSNGSTAAWEMVWAMQATGDLVAEVEDADTRIGRRAAQQIIDRVRTIVAADVRLNEIALGSMGSEWILAEVDTFAERVLAGWASVTS